MHSFSIAVISRHVAAALLLSAMFGLFAGPLLAREPVPKAQAQTATDYLQVPGPLQFGEEEYRLAWSQLGQTQIRQEYVPNGESAEQYRNMLIVDAQLNSATPAQMASTMIKLLDERKTTDPLVNHDVLIKEAGGEVILDFIMSSTPPNGEPVIEWNAYRYFAVREGVLGTVAISRRGYGQSAALKRFLTELKSARARDIATLSQLPIPDIRVPETQPAEPQP